MKLAKDLPTNKAMVVNMSGRGDKDIFILARALDDTHWRSFLEEEIARHA